MKKIHHYIVRFIYTRNVNVLGWPSRQRWAVWWLYELKYQEPWREVAARIDALHASIHAWLAEAKDA